MLRAVRGPPEAKQKSDTYSTQGLKPEVAGRNLGQVNLVIPAPEIWRRSVPPILPTRIELPVAVSQVLSSGVKGTTIKCEKETVAGPFVKIHSLPEIGVKTERPTAVPAPVALSIRTRVSLTKSTAYIFPLLSIPELTMHGPADIGPTRLAWPVCRLMVYNDEEPAGG